jgi:hypothetical protein
VSGILKFLYFFIWNVHHFQQVVLEISPWYVFWKVRRITVFLEFVSQLDGSGTNWHSCAMKAEWEQYVVTVKSFVPSVKIALGHGEGVTEMQKSVHVSVGESLEKLGFLVGLN